MNDKAKLEIWKDIGGYAGLYQVSNLGRVKSLPKARSSRVNFLKHRVDSGYARVSLSVNGKARNHSVHRLIAIEFIKNIDNLPVVNHIDGNKLNNSISNLEWVTSSENSLHAYRIGLMDQKGEAHASNKLINSDIPIIIEMYIKYNIHQKKIAACFNISQQQVSKIVTGIRWKHLA